MPHGDRQPPVLPTHRPVILHLPVFVNGQYLLQFHAWRHATMQVDRVGLPLDLAMPDNGSRGTWRLR
jgi:hypothetical protein